MQSSIAIIVAAAIGLGTLGVSAHTYAQAAGGHQQERQVGEGGSGGHPGLGQGAGVGHTGDRPGAVPAEAGAGAQTAHQADVKFIIARVTDAVLSETGTTQLLAYLTEHDRQRLSGDLDLQDPQLRQTISQFNQVWKQKYNTDFDVGARLLAFEPGALRVLEGELRDTARPAGERIGGDAGAGTPGQDAAGGISDASGGTAGAAAADTPADPAETTRTDAAAGASARGDIATTGQNITVIIPESHNAPTVILHLTRGEALAEASWKIDLPESVDAQTLPRNLQRHIAQLAAHPDQLPEDEDQAYVVVSQHVLAALTDASGLQEREQMDGPQPGLDQRPGEAGELPGQPRPDRGTPGIEDKPALPPPPGEGAMPR